MTPEEERELEEIIETILWLEEEIQNCIDDPDLDEFGKAYLRNLVKYLERDDKRFTELINRL